MAIRCAFLLLWMCPLIVHLADVVEEEPQVSQVVINSGWKLHGSREFNFFNIKRTWEEAERTCKTYNGHLASVHDESEDTVIKQLIEMAAGQDVPTWLGGFNHPDLPSHWYWSDKSDFNFERWARGQPDGSGNRLLTNYYGGWDDQGSNSKYPFVCAR